MIAMYQGHSQMIANNATLSHYGINITIHYTKMGESILWALGEKWEMVKRLNITSQYAL